MAINKKLIHFDMTKQLFMSNANGLNNLTKPTNGIVGNIPYYSVVFLKDGYIWTHGHFINGTGIADSVSGNATISWSKITDKPSTFTPSAHTQAYTTLTGSGTTANQAIVSSGTANGWTLKTLGSRAFDSTSYLPLAGGTMNAGAMIVWQDWGQWGASSPTYPKANGGLQWSGTSDWIKLFAEETAPDDLRLILQCGDDTSPQFNIRNYEGITTVSLHSNGTITGTSIINSGSNNNYVLLGGGGTKALSDFLYKSGGILTGNLILKGDTTDNMTYSGNLHPCIRFDNSDSSQNVSLIFTDYDSYRYPAGLKLVGNQGNEWFEAPAIYQNGTKVSVEGHTHPYLPLSGGTLTGNLSFSNSGTEFRGINCGTMGDNDQWRIGGAATGSNGGYMEIATADDGNEPIYVRQYTGVFSTLTRTLTLLDESGNSSFPGKITSSNTVTSSGFVKSGSDDNYFLLGGGGHVARSSYASSGHTHNYITSLGNKDASDLSSTYPNGLSVAGIYNNGYPFTYGNTITANGNRGYFQIAGQWSAAVSSLTDPDHPTEMYIRGRRDSYDVWTTWTRVLTNRNWSSVITLPTKSSWNYDDSYLKLSGGTLTGTLTMKTNGSDYYNQGIRINRVNTSSWALLLIGKSGDATSGTGTATAGDGAWLIGTPASSNSLIFNLNDASESKGLCLKGHGANDMKWNDNTVYHAGNLPAYPTKASWNYDDRYSFSHQPYSAAFAFNTEHNSNYVTFDGAQLAGAPNTSWYNGFVSTHNNYLSSYLINSHRTSDWYVGYSESKTAPTWYKLIHSGNYTYFTVTKTGSGASGTWGINISGNAATATQATQDSDGSQINTTYLKRSGGTMTGTPYISMPSSAATISDSQPFGITYGRIQGYSNIVIAADTDRSASEYAVITSGYDIANATKANGLAIGYNTLTWKNNTVWHAGNDGSGSGLDADLLDGYHESSFLRHRVTTYTNQEGTLWSQIGIKQYNDALPDSLSNTYAFGEVISFATTDARFDIYASHLSSDNQGLYYRSGWDNDKKPWRHILDSYNSSVSKSGETLTVTINGTSQSLTNTWRGIQNNLTSSSTTDSLSAYQGYLLANGSARDNTKLPLTGGTMTGTLSFSNNTGISGIMGGGSDSWGIVGTGEGDNGRLKIYVTDNATNDWLDFEFRDYSGTTYTPLSMTGNQIVFNYNPTVSGHSLIHAGNIGSQSVAHATTATRFETDKNLWGVSLNSATTYAGPMTFSSLAMATNYNDTWSDGTNSHPWYGYDHRYANTGVYSTTISDFFGMTLKTGSGNISIDNNGSVGIGTFTPSYKLDVNGTLHASGATTLSSTLSVGNNATIGGTLGVTGTTTLKSTTTITANTYISGETYFSAADAFRLNYGSYGVIHRNNGGSYWILLTNKNEQNGGFNNLRPFHIDFSTGTVYMDNNAIIDNLAFTQCNISMGGRVNATWGYDLSTNDYYGLYFKSKNTSSTGILFNDDGNVGIGTTSPLRKLHVIGEAIFGESGYVASQGTGSNYSGTWVGTGFMELSSPNPYIDFHGNKSTADYTSRLIQWGDKVRLKYENSNVAYNGYILTCEGNHHNPVILGIFDLKRSGPGSTVWTLDNICGPCVFTLANNWGYDTTFDSNTYWTIPSNLLRVEINGTYGANYTTKTVVKAASCIGTVMTRWINNQPVVSNRSHEHVEGCSVECLCTDKAPGTNLYYDSNSPGKYIYITGARPYGYDEGTNGLSMDQFRRTGHLSYLRVRFVVYGWLE